MTQHSLITRLKAVEEALDKGRSYAAFIGSDEDFNSLAAALSDLRELIKEAEGKKPIGCFDAEYKTFSLVGQFGWEDLYTALGEKP